MARQKAAWGMEVGASAIKALRLEQDGDRVVVTDFAVVPHKKVLSSPDVDQDDMTRLSLGQFISQKVIEGEQLVMSVPGHAAFARFAKLPPVDPKKVPDIVKFEAVQQIPFPIEQVEWDYQTFTSDDSPEIEVGIFAITRDRVQQRLALYRELGIAPEALTLSPVAVYNAMAFDHELARRKGPVIYLDIGTYATDVIVAEHGRCWIRTFPLGGTHFSEAIAEAFKLSYAKAEKLKIEAASSKYAKQIMQAMRPVFSDLLQDLQRSIGYYQTLHRDAELTTMVGLGSTFKIPGLRKFLGQQLQMQVLRLDEYRKITVSGREAATFAQNAVGMATAYGLALQGLGLERISANLVPVESIRSQMWRQKTKWFGAAAAIAVVGSAMLLYRPITDRGALGAGGEPAAVTHVLSTGSRLKSEYDRVSRESQIGFAAENFRRIVDDREIWPYLIRDGADALASTDPQPALLSGDVVKILAIRPGDRRFVQLDRLDGSYYFVPEGPKRRIAVTMDVTLSHDRPIEFLNRTVAAWLRDNAERPGMPYRILSETVSCNPASLAKVAVTDEGEELVASAGGRPPGVDRPAPTGVRDAPGRAPAAGGGSTKPGGFGFGGGVNIGRRQKGDTKRSAPGRGGGGSLGAGGGSSGGSAPSVPRSAPGRTGSSGSSESTGAHKDLDALGPVPGRPSLYPSGSEYYRVPITFEVELLDKPIEAAPGETAARDDKGAAS